MKRFLFILLVLSYNLTAQIPGAIDVNWGYSGLAKPPIEYRIDDFEPLPDGRIVYLATDFVGGITPNDSTKVMCFDLNGNIDSQFIQYYFVNERDGQQQLIKLYTAQQILYYQNYIYVVLTEYYKDPSSKYRLNIVKLDSNGNPDITFGQNGKLLIENLYQGTYLNYINVAIKNNEISFLAYESDNLNTHLILKKYTVNGNVVSSFGTNGILELPLQNNSNSYSCTNFIIDSTSFILTGSSEGNYFIGKLDSNGNFDNNFGINGSLNIDCGSLGDIASDVIEINGNYFIVGYNSYSSDELQCAAVNNNGQLDFSFNNTGTINIINPDFKSDDKGITVGQNDSKFIVCGASFVNPPYHKTTLSRINANGTKDNTFGNNGIVVIDFGEYFIFYGRKIKLWQNKILINGEIDDGNTALSSAILRLENDYINGISENSPNDIFYIYPNPTQRDINIESALANKRITAKVYNSFGQNIFTQQYYNSTIINLQNIASSGIYILALFDDDGAILKYQKIILQ